MIILYEDNEVKFESLGIGVLTDAISCLVEEGLNDNFILEMEYPIDGQFYDELEIGKIISCKPNPFSSNQPFRISYVSKPIDGVVTIKALHISYDMNGILVGPISANSIEAVINDLENKSLLPHNFKFKTNIQSLTSFQTTNYYNMRALLFRSSESILDTYKLEIEFDRFQVNLLSRRGSDKGCQIRYAKNMTDLTHEISYDNLYNGVYPYYHKESGQANIQNTSNEFIKAYIVGDKPLQDGWLSFSENGEPYHPIDSSPVQIATQGEYYNKVFCWDDSKQRYSEKLYDQTTTIVEGAVSPEWIYIDWSGIPNIVVKANKPGYFKTVSETEWVHHDVGDIVFKGSIRSVLSALIINYSEVIPGTVSNMDDVSNSVTHTDLTGEKIIWVDTELAHSMRYNRILQLDVTSEFDDDEEVNDENITKKAKEYIKENKIGQYKYNTKVSFVDLTSVEGLECADFDKIELGDSVRVIYESLGVDIELRAVKTTYNAIEERYESIELGEKSETISSSSVQAGDSVSSLSNDKGYTTQPEVVNIIAKTVTADYIKAANAKLSQAQIEDLTTARIRCTGILEASQFDIDKLVAKLLIADNAEIKETLSAGHIKVSGDIEVKSGEINIQNEDGSKVFNVDREGNLTANSAKIIGIIEATSGKIGGFSIGETSISSNLQSMIESSEQGVYIGPDGISLGKQLKIFPDGAIISSVVSASMDPESIQRRLTSNIETTEKSEDIITSYNGAIYGGKTPSEIENVGGITILDIDSVINILESGNLENADGTIISVKSGDNVVIRVNENNSMLFEILEDDSFKEVYFYKGLYTATTLNQMSAQGKIKFGDIFKIDEEEDEVPLVINSGGATQLIEPGSYVIFGLKLQYQTEQDWEFSIFHFAEISDDSFFGLTPDGILYANGAVISGDITVKSGEINIQNEDGTKVFRVTRDGDVYANNVALVGQISAISGEIGGFLIDQDSMYVIDQITSNKTASLTSFVYDGDYGIPIYCAYIKGINWFANNITFKEDDYDPYDDGSRLIEIGNYSINFIGTSGTSTYRNCSISYNLNQNSCRLAGTWIGTITPPSDIKLKKDINTIDDRYSILFDNLNPRIYKFKDGTSDRYHTGFIVQEVLDSMKKAEISSDEYGLCCAFGDPNDPTTNWGLRYDELIALCVKEIQNLKLKIKELNLIIDKFNKRR